MTKSATVMRMARMVTTITTDGGFPGVGSLQVGRWLDQPQRFSSRSPRDANVGVEDAALPGACRSVDVGGGPLP